MKVEVKIVNAFTKDGQGGNPAAIVLDADRFTTDQKQEIARLVGLSETAFVGKSAVASFKLDFFTPNRQIAHCGHATIATFSYLLQQSMIVDKEKISKETIDGVREIRIEGGEIYMQQKAPVFTPVSGNERLKVIHSAGLVPGEVIDITICNTGNSFVLIEVDKAATLAGLIPDHSAIKLLSESYRAIGFYPFVRTSQETHDAIARMFAPFYGIEEEAATGMAAGPLACYLHLGERDKTRFTIEQG
ncbi:MAG: PhzF family phenazine biosynthesis protein, partial [Sphingobacteriales bacterium]